MRKDVPLIGVCPEAMIAYPKINPSKRKDNELTNGHTHFFLVGDDTAQKFEWGQEAKLKAEIAKRIAKGRSKYDNKLTCKIITIVVGDNEAAVEDIKQAEENCFPCVFLEGSPMTDNVIVAKGGFPQDEEENKEMSEAVDDAQTEGKEQEEEKPKADGRIDDPFLKGFVDEGKFFICKSNSEDLANITHLALTVTLLDLKPAKQDEEPDEMRDDRGASRGASGGQQ